MKHTTKITPILFTALLTLTSCAQMFQSKLPMGSNSNTTLDVLFESKEEITQLEAPKQVFVSQGQNPTTILLSWDAVDGATSYTVERAIVKDGNSNTIPDESEFTIINKFVYGTSYTDVVLPSNEAHYTSEAYTNNYKYYYRIIAQNPRESYEPSLPTQPVYGTLFSPVLKLNADLGKSTNTITVYWDEVPNAKSYQIWRGVNSNGTGMEKIATVSPAFDINSQKLIFKNKIDTIEQGTEFYYKVIPVNISGNESVNSPLAMGFSLMSGAPTAPTNVKIADGRGTKNSIQITWDAVTADGEVKYTIFRTSSADSSLTQIVAGQSANSFTDSKSLKPNVYYYYQVQAYTLDITGNKLKSPMSDSNATSKNPAEGFILSAPNSIKVQKRDDSLYLLWQPSIGNETEQAAYTYNIYYSVNEKTDYNICDSGIPTTELEDGYIVSKVSTIAEFYKISTVYNEVESALSQAVAPSPNPVESITVSKNANLQTEMETLEEPKPFIANPNGVYPVKIEWQAPSDSTSLSGYNVYRSTKPDSGFRKINETPIPSSENRYFDYNETAKTRTYYYYRVLTVNSLEQGNEYSETKSGYGSLTPEQYMREYNKTAINSQTKLTLMHKSNDMDKLGSETAKGAISGTLSYNAKIDGLGARITMHYDNYADFYIEDKNEASGVYFLITGDTNTSANMSANGSMDGVVICKGMYPGSVSYNNIQIKGGAAGGGTYGIKRDGFDGQIEVDWKIGEEGR